MLYFNILKEHQLKAPGADIFPKELLSNARHRFRTLCLQVDARPIRFHDLRHTFASCLTVAGVDIRTVQELMRHKSLAMTLRYAHLHPDYLKGATDVLAGTQTALQKHKGPAAASCEDYVKQ